MKLPEGRQKTAKRKNMNKELWKKQKNNNKK